MFAVDLKTFMVIKSDLNVARFQEDLDRFHEWCVLNDSQLNVSE